MSNLRQQGHIVEKGTICPNCGEKDSILFSSKTDKQNTLMGEKTDIWRNIKPTCEKCKMIFSKGTLFRKVR